MSPRDLAVSALSVGVTDVYCETLLSPWFWVHEFETSCLCGRNFIHGVTSLALKGFLKVLSFAFGEWTMGSLVVLAPASIRTIRVFPWNSLAQRVSQVCCTASVLAIHSICLLRQYLSPLLRIFTHPLSQLFQQQS